MAKAKTPVIKNPRRIGIQDVPWKLHSDFKKACSKKKISMNLRLQELMKQDIAI